MIHGDTKQLARLEPVGHQKNQPLATPASGDRQQPEGLNGPRWPQPSSVARHRLRIVAWPDEKIHY